MKPKLFIIIAVMVLAAVCARYYWNGRRPGAIIDQSPRLDRELNAIAFALGEYRTLFNNFPSGDEAVLAEILIRGKNPKGQRLLNWNETRLDQGGRMLDLWGTAYRILIASNNFVTVRSAGPNKQFGDEDDKVLTRQY